MRAARAVAKFLVHASSPISSTTTSTYTYTRAAKPPTPPPKCDAHTCPWWPYSNSNDFEVNATLILIILFSALVFALALNIAIRCLLLRHPHQITTQLAGVELPHPNPKPSLICTTTAPPTRLFSAGMKLGGAVAECTICLSDFAEGDGIQLLARCSHGFHIQCIQEWLSSHSSCPTCRTNCHPTSSSSSSSNDGGESDSPQATA